MIDEPEPRRDTAVGFAKRSREIDGYPGGRFIDHCGVLAELLARVHRDVGLPQQIVRRLGRAVGPWPDQTHTGLHPHRRTVQCERVAQRDPQPLGGVLQLFLLAVDQYRELVSADPCQRVGVAHATPEALPDRDEEFVTTRVPKPIVHLFEVIEVDENQHESAVEHRLVESLREKGPIR